MHQLQQWARVRARTNCPLRRGAWYRVLSLTAVEAVLEVHGRPLSVPRPLLQVLPIRPRMWSVVSRLRGAVTPPASWGARYGVCPRCAARAPLHERQATLRCPNCSFAFLIAWSDSHWRVFRLLRRREVARHLAVLVAFDLRPGGPVAVPRVHELPHAVRVRGDARLELSPQRLVDGPLPLRELHALLRELLLRPLELRGLVVRQVEILAHARVPPLSDLLPQLLCFSVAARVGRGLRRERGRHQREQHDEQKSLHVISSPMCAAARAIRRCSGSRAPRRDRRGSPRRMAARARQRSRAADRL